MKKSSLLSAALCVALLSPITLGHEICFYTSRSAKGNTEEKCREACSDYDSDKYGRCFAYRFSFRDDTCTIYVFSKHNKFVDYTDCGANYGGLLTLDEPAEAQGSEEAPEGCRLGEEVLGITSNPSTCAALCTSFFDESDSKVFGGCAAWFWDPNDEQCVGLMTQESPTRSVCSTVG